MLFKIDTLRKLLFSKNKVEYLDFAIADNDSGGLIQDGMEFSISMRF